MEGINTGDGISPMDPPSAYEPPAGEEKIPYEELHPFLQSLTDEHDEANKELEVFSQTINMMKNGKLDKEADKRLRDFFFFLDEVVFPHNQKEEKTLFAPISDYLYEQGEASKGRELFNAIDVLEDDHNTLLQTAAVAFNFFSLFGKLSDDNSRALVLDVALQKSDDLIELLRLHIFREESALITQAHNCISKEALDKMQESHKQFTLRQEG